MNVVLFLFVTVSLPSSYYAQGKLNNEVSFNNIDMSVINTIKKIDSSITPQLKNMNVYARAIKDYVVFQNTNKPVDSLVPLYNVKYYSVEKKVSQKKWRREREVFSGLRRISFFLKRRKATVANQY